MKVRPALIDSKVGANVRANSDAEQGKVMVRLLQLDFELPVMAGIERWN